MEFVDVNCRTARYLRRFAAPVAPTGFTKLVDLTGSSNHCSRDRGLWKIAGAHLGATVCVMNYSGGSQIAERECGKTGSYASGSVIQVGVEKYCVIKAGGRPDLAFGWWAVAAVPDCELRYRGKHIKSLGTDWMPEAACLAKVVQ